jgi:hypothetical protein
MGRSGRLGSMVRLSRLRGGRHEVVSPLLMIALCCRHCKLSAVNTYIILAPIGNFTLGTRDNGALNKKRLSPSAHQHIIIHVP